MGTSLFRSAAMAVVFAAAALAGGCGGNGSSSAAQLSGLWSGSLTLSYQNGGGASGDLDLDLDQLEDFVSGVAVWQPLGSTQSIAGPVDGNDFKLLLHFRCDAQAEAAELTGTLDGSTMTITGGSGAACTDGGEANVVSGASGSLTHTSDGSPL